MIKRRADQSGLAITQTLLIIAVVVVVGIIGGLVYRHNNKTVNNATSPNPPTDQQQVANNNQTTQQPQPLIIKEWGVQLPLSESIADAYYAPSTGGRGFDGIVNQIYISVKSLDGSGCTATGNGDNHNGVLSTPAMILRTKPTEVDPVTNKTYPQEYPDGVTVGGYFYAYQKVADPSASGCKASPATLQEVDSAIAAAAKNIKEASTGTN